MGADILAVVDIQGNIYPLLNWWIFYNLKVYGAWGSQIDTVLFTAPEKEVERPF